MSDNNFAYNDLKKIVDVSRETFSRLEDYVDLLRKWQKRINLISDATLGDIWSRHIMDSAQLMKYLVKGEQVIDIGSGAGFPGMVLAILGIENMTLVESDSRKVAFLRETARITKTNIKIQNKRIEKMELVNRNIITSRAFASIKDTLNCVDKNLHNIDKLLLLKGKNTEEELEEAKESWKFDCQSIPSITEGGGFLVSIENITKTGG